MMEHKEIKSPFTGGPVKEMFQMEAMSFRGEEYLVHGWYFICEDTGRKFSTGEQDNATLNDLYAQYRVKHNIPFPDEIASIRKRYGLNQSQIGKLLGFGVNQWAKYENGQVPSESNGRLIGALRRKSVALSLVQDLRSIFEEDEYKKILNAIQASPDQDIVPDQDSILYRGTSRSIENGFGEFHHQKVEEMVKFFAAKGIGVTKLNKKMFYADFLHFKHYGISISGLRYQAIHYGPVPVHYATVYDNIPGLERHVQVEGENERITYESTIEPNLSVFSPHEITSLETVEKLLGNLSTREIVELSHKETAWQEHYGQMEIIPYSEAYLLNI